MADKPSMVDISGKPSVSREAVAEGLIKLRPETLKRVRQGLIEKGDPLNVATIMAILTVKETPKIIALCHPIPITNVKIDYQFLDDRTIRVLAKVKAYAQTGVEMEALTAVATALLNIWDMVKVYEKDEGGQYPHTQITRIRVVRKFKESLNNKGEETLSETSLKHKAEAPSRLKFALVTVSTSKASMVEAGRHPEDLSGDLAAKLVEEAGHMVVYRRIIPDDSAQIKELVENLLTSHNLDAIVTIGGTGISPSDVTIESVEGLLEKKLPGFGELLRFSSFRKVGSPVMLTRALAGTSKGKAVFCLPGSPNAVELAFKELIIPEAGHIVKHAREC